MTQLEAARKGIITKEMKYVAEYEKQSVEIVREEIASGRAVIPANINHKNLKPVIIGSKFKTKVNANIGTSKDKLSAGYEKEKLEVALKFGTDAVMDLSTAGDLNSIRKELIANCPVAFGTVPIYQAVKELKDIYAMSAENILEIIKQHALQGVDFITIHSGVTRKCIPLVEKRLAGVVSRGGAFLIAWMKHHNKENPMFTHFDEILEIAKEYDLTLSLGDGMRPGSIIDATDEVQITELKTLGELTLRAWEKGVQVMIEGPGHVPVHMIQKNVELEQKLCHDAPFYVLGPLVTDVAPGYDHITGAMGGLLAAYYGASMLCYVTPKEHVGLPAVEDVKQGVIAFKIAAHAADLGRNIPGAYEWDERISRARKELKWDEQFKAAIDPETAKKFHDENPASANNVCSMCSEFCSMKLMNELNCAEKKPR